MAGESFELARKWWSSVGSQRRVEIALRTHAVFALIGAVGAVAQVVRVRVGLGEVLVRNGPLVLFALASLPASYALFTSSGRPIAVLLRVLASFAVLFVGLAFFGVDMTPRRALDGEFARGVGRLVPPERKLLVIDGNPQLLLYYGDHVNEQISTDRLAAALQKDPDALLVDSESHIEHAQRAGRVLLREAADADEDARVLFEFAPQAEPGGGSTQH
jgi:hypothetical protein